MLSAVESFGSASAAAAHPYAHHNPFAIAAAAAAAGSAAAAAAAVIPSHHHHHHHHHLNHSHHQLIKSNSTATLEHQFVLSHNSIYNNNAVSVAQNNHISNPHLGSGIFLPPPPPPRSTITLIPSSAGTNTTTTPLPTALVLPAKCSSQEQPKSPRDRSPRSKSDTFPVQQSSDGSRVDNMSSAEFVRPHPKQPRYSNNSNSNNIITATATTTNNNINNHTNNNNYTSNAIPLHLRSNTKLAGNHSKSYNGLNSPNNSVASSDKNHLSPSNILNNNNCINNNNTLNKTTSVTVARAKYSTEQTGPVNLVTNNNTNSVNHNNSCRTPPTSLALETSNPSAIGGDGSDCSRKQMPSDVYAQKLPFATAQTLASAYQYNYPHIYASRVLYGTPALFTGHHPLGHSTAMRPCPTYLPGQHDAFAPYLHAAGVYQSPVAPNVPSQQQNTGLLRIAPQVILNNNNLTGPTNSSSPIERVCSFAVSKDLPSANGTYLNGKVNTSPAAPESVSGFKVPCGKEGSLKHRILTRPSQSDRDASKGKSPITVSVVKSNSSSSSNFTKGAYIELANGVLRRVEDMRTEDFIHSAEKSAVHQLAESTVVKIGMTSSSSVVITFSYDKNRAKADIEVSQEHPFFVYGQGWASCNPELTLKLFGLKCQRLQVGDICISLKSREQQSEPVNNSQQSSLSAIPSQQYDKQNESISVPQNLSRKLISHSTDCTVPTVTNTTTITGVTNNRQTSMGAPTYIPQAHGHVHVPHPYDENSPVNPTYDNQISRHPEFFQPQLHLHPSYHRILGHGDVTMPSTRLALPPPSLPPQSHSAPVQQTCPPTLSQSSPSSYYQTTEARHPAQLDSSSDTSQQPVDASLSRKRRWSAPESICDDDENECPPVTVSRHSNPNAFNT